MAFFFIESLDIIEECIKEVDDETSELVINDIQTNELSTQIATAIDDTLVNESDMLMRRSIFR